MNVSYFGARPKPSLTRMLNKEGYQVVYARYKKGILASLPCAALVLHWKSQTDQQLITEAHAAGVPIMVITDKLIDAYSVADPLADLYLEEPASDEDVTALLTDMIASERNTAGDATGLLGIGLAA